MNKQTLGSAAALVLIVAGGAWYSLSGHHLGSGGAASAGSAETVAVVNGENIPRSDLDKAESQITAQQGGQAATTTDAQAALQKQALDSLIARALLSQAAKQGGFTASSTEVDAQLASTEQQVGGKDALDKALATQGLTEDTFRTQLAENLAIQAYLSQTLDLSSITVSDAEVQSAYTQLTAGQQSVPPLAQVHDQVKQLVLQQKQQQLISGLVDKLRAAGSVQVLI